MPTLHPFTAFVHQNWPVWLLSLVLVVAAVIDGWKLKVPNWITFPLVLGGWIYSGVYFGWEGLGWSLLGTLVGLMLLLPAYAIGGMGAGDVKLLAGVGRLGLGYRDPLCVLRLGHRGRRNRHRADRLEGRLVSPHLSVLGDRQRDFGGPRPQPVVVHGCAAKEHDDALALWYSHRDWLDFLFYLGWDAAMISPIPPIAPILGGVTTPKTDSNGQIEAASEVGLEKTCRLCRRNRQGASAVEFALVAPVFVVMVFGLIEFGRAIMVQQVMTNAAREGARLAILDSPTPVATTVRTPW